MAMRLILFLAILTLYFVSCSGRCHFHCLHLIKRGGVCPPLKKDNCEIVQCGCCKECALNLNDQCSYKTPRCATGLLCVNPEKGALKVVPHNMKDFVGVCQNVELSPVVVENTPEVERRFRI